MAKKHDIIWLESIDSTNEEARRRISSLDNLSVLSAFCQKAGRGQRGNTWSAKAGENLTFSIVLKFGTEPLQHIRAADQFAISEMTALSVIDLLAVHGIEAKIKWPNDIYAGSRKICGILIENSVRKSVLSSSIIGIGLNVNQTEFDPSLPNPTSMKLCIIPSQDSTAEPISLTSLLEEFMDIFEGYSRRYLNNTGGLSCLRELYLSQMWRINEPARFIDYTYLPTGHLDAPVNISSAADSCKTFTGIIRGLTPVGNLLVEDCSVLPVRIREFAFKEIGYVL